MTVLPRNTILVGDALEQLRTLPSQSIDTVITSPPYYQLRSYGMATREYGQEPHVDDWVTHLRKVCAEIHRVLVPTGSFWLNLGDSYSRHDRYGAPAKSLLLGPERLVLALVQDGWRLRNSAVWSKTNPMPSSVRDRLSCTWEHVYFLTKQSQYHFDLDAVRIPHLTPAAKPNPRAARYLPVEWQAALAHDNDGLAALKRRGRVGHPAGKNPGDVWRLATGGYTGAHFATFPTSLVELPLAATCPRARCAQCRTPIIHQLGQTAVRSTIQRCDCRAPSEPGIVLDPFMGAGTVGVAAESHGRDWLGIELNPRFAVLAERRIANARSSGTGERAA